MTDDLVGRLEAWADSDAEYGHHARSADWLAAKARIEALEAALRPFASLDVLEPNGVVIGLERFHFERARSVLPASGTSGNGPGQRVSNISGKDDPHAD